MMTDLEFDQLLEASLAVHGPHAAHASLADHVLDDVRRVGQRRPLFPALDRRAWPPRPYSPGHPATVRALRIGLLALLTLALISVWAVVGAGLLEQRDGGRLVFGRDGGLFLDDLDGSAPRQIASGGRFIEPRFSGDGRWIAADFVPSGARAERHVVVLGADGNRKLALPPGINPTRAYEWGAAGASAGWLAAVIDGSIIVVDAASERRLTIPVGPATSIYDLAWSPDSATLWWITSGPSGFAGIAQAEVHSIRIEDADGQLRIAEQHSFTLRLDPTRTYRSLERIAVSPDGETLAIRARLERMLRSDVLLVDAEGGLPISLTPLPPDDPGVYAWSGIRWTADGHAVVVEIADQVGPEEWVIRPAILPVDGSPPRWIDVGPIPLAMAGAVVPDGGTVSTSDSAVLVGVAHTWIDVPGGEIPRYDLWLTEDPGLAPRLVATETTGGDVR